jgi:phosphoribosylaminoimidazole (AIR) synthetase
MKKKLTYADAGVDIDKADHLVDAIKKNRQENPKDRRHG